MRLTSILAASLLAIPATAQNPQIQLELGVGSHNTAGGKNTPTAVTPAVSLHGEPCASACGALNDMGGTQRSGTLPNEYCYAYQPSTAQTMVGFSLWTNSTTQNLIEVMDCNVYREAAAGTPAATAVATGKMGVQGGAAGWYHVILDMPVAIAANETIWISQLDTTRILPSAKTAGTAPPARTFWRRGTPPGAWSPTGLINFPVYRILCDGATLATSDDLKINATGNVTLVDGPVGFPAGLLLGATNPALPFGCGTILAQPSVVLNGQIGTNGTLAIPLAVPNDPCCIVPLRQ